MKLIIEVEITREEGQNLSAEDVAAGVAELLDGETLWLGPNSESRYDVKSAKRYSA